MNCLEFQRELNADPRRLSADALGHAETCPDCARRMAGQFRQEARWEAELQIATPVGMEDRILLATRFGRQKRQRSYAIAAVLVASVAVAVSMNVMGPQPGAQDLAVIAVDHVQAEPEHLHETHAVNAATLNSLFARVGAQVQGPLPVTFAGACVLPGGTGGHIVMATSQGRVTLMLMPNGKTDVVVHRTIGNLLVEVNAARHGSYSLVAPNERALVEAKAILARNLRWT